MNRSTELNELFSALAKAQSEMLVAELNQKNTFFKSRYADLAAIVRASRPALTKYGLSVNQFPEQDEQGNAYLVTFLGHSSGQWMSGRMKINPPKNDIQSLSSYSTYIQRLSYKQVVGVVAGDEDDDGEAAVAPTRNGTVVHQVAQPAVQPATPVVEDYITKEQADMMERELKSNLEVAETVLAGLDKLGIPSITMIPKRSFNQYMDRIYKMKDDLKHKAK